MEQSKAIPTGYMTVGQAAQMMDVTVRTLQHYDKIGLLSPSARSEGGRRLYTDKDIVRLHQVLSLKTLGFSLEDIRDRLTSLDTPQDVADALSEQAAAIRRQIASLSCSLQAVETLRAEVLEMQTVDFRKYADIVVNLEMRNDLYWLIKHFDEETLERIRQRFDKRSATDFISRLQHLEEEAVRLSSSGVLPDSPVGRAFAESYWDMLLEFTGMDPTLLPKLRQIADDQALSAEWKQKHAQADGFITPALEAYFAATGISPFDSPNE